MEHIFSAAGQLNVAVVYRVKSSAKNHHLCHQAPILNSLSACPEPVEGCPSCHCSTHSSILNWPFASSIVLITKQWHEDLYTPGGSGPNHAFRRRACVKKQSSCPDLWGGGRTEFPSGSGDCVLPAVGEAREAQKFITGFAAPAF